MENLTKETVIIVHGTWAEPKADNLSWYEIPDDSEHQPNFVSKLDKELEKSGSPARCWAHCDKDNSKIFSWSGKNAWIDRTRASFALAAYINKLQADGWRCHVVAHSHGGNVVAEALPAVTQTIDQPAGISGTITTLGAPFIDAMSPITKQITLRRKLLKVLAWSLYLLFIVLCVTTAALPPDKTGPDTFYIFTFLTVSALLLGVTHFLRRRQKKVDWNEVLECLYEAKFLPSLHLLDVQPHG